LFDNQFFVILTGLRSLVDKTLMEKINLIESLEEKEKVSIFNIIDSLVVKKD
jgi:hypothetical protein